MSAQAASVQLIHCVCPGCGLPHRIMWLSVYRFPVTVLAFSLLHWASPQSPSLSLSLFTFLSGMFSETDMEIDSYVLFIPSYIFPKHNWLTFRRPVPVKSLTGTFLCWNLEILVNIAFKQLRFDAAKFWNSVQQSLFSEHFSTFLQVTEHLCWQTK